MKSPNDADELVDLLDEFLLASEEGPVNLEDFERRAGVQADQFLRCVELSGEVRGLSSFLTPPEEHSFGRFVQRRMLGAGGHSTVYLAWDTQLEREVALKVLTLPGSRESSLVEARSLARLEHPGVVRVFEVGEFQDRAYLAMEFIEGVSLRDAIEALRGAQSDSGRDGGVQGTLEHAVATALQSTAARCFVVARLARALAYCHEVGVVHRDIKPENVLTDETLKPKLIDFGLARGQVGEGEETSLGLRGTPSYFAPEQVDNEVTGASPASDQFSLGVLLYELLTLRHPFRGGSMAETLMSISQAAQTPLRKVRGELPPDIGLICAKCLEKDPSQRYSSVTELAEDLEAFAGHRAISLRPASLSRQVLREAIRNRRKLAAAATLVGLGGVLLLAADWRRARSESADFVLGVTRAQRQLGGLSDPQHYDEAFRYLADHWRQAQQLDRSKWRWLIPSSACDQLQAQWVATRERLLLALEAPPRLIEPVENASAASILLGRWGSVLHWLQYSLDPRVEVARPDIFGSLLLPKDCTAQLYSGRPDRPVLERQDHSTARLQAGQYRLRLSGPRERDVVLRSGELDWEPAVRALDGGVRDSMISLPAGSLPADELSADDQPYTYGAFSVSPEPVSWRMVREVLTDKEWGRIGYHLGRLDSDSVRDEDPARVPWVFAAECAARLGARLPTAAELLVVLREESVALPALEGEWTSLYHSANPQRRYWCEYAEASGESTETSVTALQAMHESSWSDGVGFRLATSLPLDDLGG